VLRLLFEAISLSRIPSFSTPLLRLIPSPSGRHCCALFIRHQLKGIAMPTLPTTITSSSTEFQPAFQHVATPDRHGCSLAAVAIIAGTTFDDVVKQAESLGVPKVGPYYPWLDGDLLARLLAHYGWVATVWKECTSLTHLPALCILLVDYDADWEVGRHIVSHTAKASHSGKMVTYAIDPSATDPKLQIRDISAFTPPGISVARQWASHRQRRPRNNPRRLTFRADIASRRIAFYDADVDSSIQPSRFSSQSESKSGDAVVGKRLTAISV
jgi:hypothetical protein